MSAGRMLGAIGRAVRGTWLIAGATILVLLVIEGAYRFQLKVRYQWLSSEAQSEPPSPFEATDWARDYWIGHDKEELIRWSSYVYVRNPTFTAPHATVDAAGHRVTPLQVPQSAGPRAVRMFFLGGSTTFGWYQRAAFTFPAEAGRRAQSLVGDGARVDVTNFGAPGRTFTQEVIELTLALRAGARPDVVIFFDGINDVMATVQNAEAGFPQNEWKRDADFRRGRVLEARPGLWNDVKAATTIAAHLAAARLQVVQRLATVSAPASAPSTETLAESLVSMYVGNVRIVEALAASYGFTPLYVWQPALLSTTKPLTRREAWLVTSRGAFVETVRALHVAVPPRLRQAVPQVVGNRFVDATDVFRDDPGEVFVDTFGHMYERANPPIVDRLEPVLRSAIAAATQPSQGDVLSREKRGQRHVPHGAEPGAGRNDTGMEFTTIDAVAMSP
jgi:lysophospholipase L1-like esterase